MAKKNNQKLIGVFCLALFVGVLFGPQIIQGISNLLGGNIIITPPPGGSTPQKFYLYKEGTSTALTNVEVYAWYDWNGDGAVQLGEYPAGEIESLTSDGTSGLVTTQLEYPIGKSVYYQCHKATYETVTLERVRSSLPSAYDGSALSVPNGFMTLTDTGESRVSVDGSLLVSGSTDYNYTAGTTEPIVQFRHTSTSTDSGINEAAYTHWGNGKVYGGTFVGVVYTNQDFIDLHPDGFDGVFVGATYTYTWYWVDGYFNDNDVTGDEVFTLEFNMDITAAGDIYQIGIWNTVELDDIQIGVWGTQIGTIEDNLDFVA